MWSAIARAPARSIALRPGVIAGRAQRLPQSRIVGVVAVPAAITKAMRAAATLAARVTGQHWPPLRLAGVDAAEGWGR